HEPDRRVVGRLAQACAQEGIVLQGWPHAANYPCTEAARPDEAQKPGWPPDVQIGFKDPRNFSRRGLPGKGGICTSSTGAVAIGRRDNRSEISLRRPAFWLLKSTS